MNTRQNDLFCPTIQSRLNICENFIHCTRLTFAPRDSGDTESTVVITTILDLDEGACTLAHSRQGGPFKGFDVESFKGKIQKISNQIIFLIVENDKVGTRHLGSLIRLHRYPTACGNDIFHPGTACAPYLGSGIRCRFGCDGAGINDSHIRQRGFANDLMSRCAKLAGDLFDLCLIKTAANGVQEDFHRE